MQMKTLVSPVDNYFFIICEIYFMMSNIQIVQNAVHVNKLLLLLLLLFRMRVLIKVSNQVTLAPALTGLYREIIFVSASFHRLPKHSSVLSHPLLG